MPESIRHSDEHEDGTLHAEEHDHPGNEHHEHHAMPAASVSDRAMGHAGHDQHAHHDEHAEHAHHVNHDMPAASMARVGQEEHAGQGEHAHHADHTGHEQMFRTRFWRCLVLSIPVLAFSPFIQGIFGFRLPAFPGSDWIPFVFSLAIFAHGGVPFLRMAVPEVRNREPGMMTLITLAISVALIYSLAAQLLGLGEGFFWELVTLIDIMLLGHWMEMRSVRQASGALNELARLMPDTAELLLPDGSSKTVKANTLKTDDVVLVRPGASIPADGQVIDGESSVNESMITGESRPVDKQPQAKVIAGTINGDGSLRVQVTATGDQTALAGIMRLVQQAQQSKSRTQLLADRAAGWLFYVALGVAGITAVAWILSIGFSLDVLKRVVTVLVIACPHALGLAVPLVVAITTSMGARNGILIRDRLALETARLIDVVVFDKTGTLTKGEFGVVGVVPAAGWTEERALALAAAVEGDSEHLIARAIRKVAQERKLELPAVKDFSAIKGRGVKAMHADKDVYTGGPRLLEMLGLVAPPEIASFAESAGSRAQSVVYLVDGQQVAAAFAVADVIRPESRKAVDTLHKMNVQVAMLTGDSRPVAAAVAHELGIDQVFAEVLPENKDQKIAELQSQGRKVAMVGDGVNDAPALTRADVGIAIGGGTDVAIESAGLILVQSNPLDVVRIVSLSRASYRKMIQNLWWAAGYNVIALPLAAGALASLGILISPAFGALLMSLSTIVVALNAQLLRRASLSTA
jgi:Cu2+-exporting ATPase